MASALLSDVTRPIRADAAWNPTNRTDESEWSIFLTVGYLF